MESRKIWGSYLQGSKGDPDTENRLLEAVGEKCGMTWENNIETYILPSVK